jgi:hypothetical protein
LFDIKGDVVDILEYNVSPGVNNIKFGSKSYSSGVYYISIFDGKKTLAGKIIKAE